MPCLAVHPSLSELVTRGEEFTGRLLASVQKERSWGLPLEDLRTAAMLLALLICSASSNSSSSVVQSSSLSCSFSTPSSTPGAPCVGFRTAACEMAHHRRTNRTQGHRRNTLRQYTFDGSLLHFFQLFRCRFAVHWNILHCCSRHPGECRDHSAACRKFAVLGVAKGLLRPARRNNQQSWRPDFT